MSHHLSGLGVSPTSGDARSHFTDLFAFQKPGDPRKTILIVNVNPVLGTTDSDINPESIYEIRIDGDGDAVADSVLRIRFSGAAGDQKATVTLASVSTAIDKPDGGEPVIKDAPITIGDDPVITSSGDYRFFAGIRSDPFFADFAGALDNFKWTGQDYFADKNVFAIVLEVPNTALGPRSQVGIWARALVRQDGQLVQGDRLGRPAIDFVYNPADEQKAIWNAQEPTEDRANFLDSFAKVFESTGHSPEEARAGAGQLLPDLLTYDYNSGAGFPNGRKPTDDVINMGIAQLSRGAVPHDGLRPHADLLQDFPYLGPPHPTAEIVGSAAQGAQAERV